MKTTRRTSLAALAVGCLTAASALAQGTDPLLNALIRKGILTQEEAEAIRAEASAEAPREDMPKWKINRMIEQIELFGDVRLRYELREGQNDASDTYARNRARYRVRIGIRGEFKEDFYYGVRVETSAAPRSTNVTFGDDGGPFAKGSDGTHIGQAYLGWKRLDWFSLEAGRIPNPLVTSRMVWDSDLNPEGVAERFRYAIGPAELFATFGQFVYDDNNPENPIGVGLTQSDDFLLAWQLGATYDIREDLSVQIAPVLYNYTGTGDSHGFPGPFSPGNPGGINDLLVVEVPVELNFQVAGLPFQLFGEFAINADGDDRAKRAGFPGADGEDMAYRAGLSAGKASKKGTWGAEAYWQHQELFALDPNLIDSDLFDATLNMEGVVLSGSYAVTDNITASVTYAFGDRIESDLPTLSSGGGIRAGEALNDYQLLQLDLSWKF